MAVDEAVDAAVQADAVLPGDRVVLRRLAAHEITQQIADQRAAGLLGKQGMGEHVQGSAPQGAAVHRARLVFDYGSRAVPAARPVIR